MKQGVFTMELVNRLDELAKLDLTAAKERAAEAINAETSILPHNRAKALALIARQPTYRTFMLAMGNFNLAFQGLKTLK
jgi:hypothetical protein